MQKTEALQKALLEARERADAQRDPATQMRLKYAELADALDTLRRDRARRDQESAGLSPSFSRLAKAAAGPAGGPGSRSEQRFPKCAGAAGEPAPSLRKRSRRSVTARVAAPGNGAPGAGAPASGNACVWRTAAHGSLRRRQPEACTGRRAGTRPSWVGRRRRWSCLRCKTAFGKSYELTYADERNAGRIEPRCPSTWGQGRRTAPSCGAAIRALGAGERGRHRGLRRTPRNGFDALFDRPAARILPRRRSRSLPALIDAPAFHRCAEQFVERNSPGWATAFSRGRPPGLFRRRHRRSCA